MPLLAPDDDAEARNNLILGISGTVAGCPGLYSAYRAWLAVEDGAPAEGRSLPRDVHPRRGHDPSFSLRRADRFLSGTLGARPTIVVR